MSCSTSSILKLRRGYKVTNAAKSRICGIGCSSLKELKAKAGLKFKLKNPEDYHFVLLDGTIVDDEDYFSTLLPQTLLILAKTNDKVSTGADIVYNALKAVNVDFLRAGEAIKNFLNENLKEKMRVLGNYIFKVGDAEDNCMKSDRKDDPKWFEGLDTSCSTKEAFLRRRCKDRIGGYFYKAKNDLNKFKKNPAERKVIQELINIMKQKLQQCDYNGGYFDRKDEMLRMCNEVGIFKCNGVWNKEKCLYIENRRHTINPYSSREERIVFSTWNLDHRIEKSRTIIPSIEAAVKSVVKGSGFYDLNYDFIFSLLFTNKNLGLVHIVCHDKGAHTTATLKHENLLVRYVVPNLYCN